jgi:hypothetical protein
MTLILLICADLKNRALNTKEHAATKPTPDGFDQRLSA